MNMTPPNFGGNTPNSASNFMEDDILMSPDILAQSIPSSFPHIPQRPDKKQFALLLLKSYLSKLIEITRF